jgi:integrase
MSQPPKSRNRGRSRSLKVLTGYFEKDEFDCILKGLRSLDCVTGRQRLAIFRLTSTYGMRATEITRFKLGDMSLEFPKPFILLKDEYTKKNSGGRLIRLHWCKEAVVDLQQWWDFRVDVMGATHRDTFLCGTSAQNVGKPLNGNLIYKRFKTGIRRYIEQAHRERVLTPHAGRRTSGSVALKAGHSLPVVSDFLGHSSIAQTEEYIRGYEEVEAKQLW